MKLTTRGVHACMGLIEWWGYLGEKHRHDRLQVRVPFPDDDEKPPQDHYRSGGRSNKDPGGAEPLAYNYCAAQQLAARRRPRLVPRIVRPHHEIVAPRLRDELCRHIGSVLVRPSGPLHGDGLIAETETYLGAREGNIQIIDVFRKEVYAD